MLQGQCRQGPGLTKPGPRLDQRSSCGRRTEGWKEVEGTRPRNGGLQRRQCMPPHDDHEIILSYCASEYDAIARAAPVRSAHGLERIGFSSAKREHRSGHLRALNFPSEVHISLSFIVGFPGELESTANLLIGRYHVSKDNATFDLSDRCAHQEKHTWTFTMRSLHFDATSYFHLGKTPITASLIRR